MMEIFLPTGIVMSVWFVIWLLASPEGLVRSLLFANNDGVVGFLVSVGTVVFTIGFLVTVAYLAAAYGDKI